VYQLSPVSANKYICLLLAECLILMIFGLYVYSYFEDSTLLRNVSWIISICTVSNSRRLYALQSLVWENSNLIFWALSVTATRLCISFFKFDALKLKFTWKKFTTALKWEMDLFVVSPSPSPPSNTTWVRMDYIKEIWLNFLSEGNFNLNMRQYIYEFAQELIVLCFWGEHRQWIS
jgi:hypothetical protein